MSTLKEQKEKINQDVKDIMSKLDIDELKKLSEGMVDPWLISELE